MSNKEKMPGAYRASENTVSAPLESGTITVSGEIAPCRIGYYEVEVKPEGHYLPRRRHSAFTGRAADGRVLDDAEFGVKEEIAAGTAEYRRRITALERELEWLGHDVSKLEKGQDNAATSLERLQLKKKANAARQELRRKRDDLFLGKIRLEQELEKRLQQIRDDARLTATVTRQFTIQVRGVKE